MTMAKAVVAGRPATGVARRAVVLLVLLLLVPLAAVAVPASPAAAAPAPIPADLWDATPDVGPGQTYVVVEGAEGDYLTQGGQFLHTQADSVISVTVVDGLVTVGVRGETSWTGLFRADGTSTPPATGYYPGLTKLAATAPASAGLDWARANQACAALTGWMAIDEIVTGAGGLSALTLRFSQSCDGGAPIHGKVRWRAADPTRPPDPVLPVPGDLWDVAPAVPTGTSYLALEGQAGNPWIGGRTELFTQTYSAFAVTEEDSPAGPRSLAVIVAGDERWTARFRPMWTLDQLQPGYYPRATDVGSGNPAAGQESVYGPSGCHVTPTSGWFAVDELSRVGGVLSSVTLRFEVSCDGGPPLRGKLRWFASDPTPAARPVVPVPAGLWDTSPPVGPAQTYVALSAPAGEPVTGGTQATYTQANSRISLSESGGLLHVDVAAGVSWSGVFRPMYPLTTLAPGYYPDAHRFPEPNRLRPALAWGRPQAYPDPCPTADGWYAVDEIARDGTVVVSATIRFGLSCDGVHTLDGKIHWNAADPTVPPGPVLPVPGGLWDVTPAGVTGDYLFIDGQAGDPITGGDDVVLPPSPGPVAAGDQAGGITAFTGSSPSDFWIVSAEGFDDHALLGPGYYGDLSSATSASPVVPGLAVTRVVAGSKVPCPSVTTGWFAVDRVTRVDGAITQLDLRFEQSCGGAPPLHGRVHIDRGGLPSGSPVGQLESARFVPGGITVAGWAIDPDTTAPVPVRIEVDGVATTVTASTDRPDVGGSHPGYGSAHGFSTTRPAVAGSHRVCAFATNTGPGAETALGCKTVTVAAGSPLGSLDSVANVAGRIQVRGWSIDPEVTDPIYVLVYVDGEADVLLADQPRPDVGAVFPGFGAGHGYSASFAARPGAHRVCAYGLNVLAGASATLGCRDVVVEDAPPFGSVDHLSVRPGEVELAGWAIDPDTTDPIEVHVYVDGGAVALRAGASRPDVALVYPRYGEDHGYGGFLRVAPGPHRVCVYGITTGSGPNALLGCRDVVVAGGPPIGSLDAVTVAGGQLHVQGWAIDPDTAMPIQVHLYVDGGAVAVTADAVRFDVVAAHPAYSAEHGFDATLGATPGPHRVCAYGINVYAGTNALLGCRTVTVG